MSNVSSERSETPSDPPKAESRGAKAQSVPWGVGAPIFLLALVFATQFSLSLAFYSVLEGLGVSQAWLDGNTSSFIVYGFTTIVSGFMLWLFLSHYRSGLKTLGLRRETLGLRQLGLVLLGIIAYLVLSIGLSTIVGLVFPGLNLNEEQYTGFTPTGSLSGLGLVFVSLVILPPLIEEAVFRGFVFAGFRAKLPFVAAALLSSLLFGLAHFQINVAIDTAALGLVLAWLYEKSGSLWPPVILHGLKNLTAFLLIFVFGL